MSTRRRAGFTLIEVLVALVVVALGMGAVLSALTNAADTTIRLREKTFATWVGMNQLAETRLRQVFPARGKTEGEVDFANARWHWRQQVEDIQIPGIKRITIDVRYADKNSDGSGSTSAKRGATDDWLATVSGFRSTALTSSPGTLSGWP